MIFVVEFACIFKWDRQIVIVALIIVFLFSPFGLTKLGLYGIGLLEILNYIIKSI